MPSTTLATRITIGDVPICIRTESAEFHRLLEDRYTGFVGASSNPSSPMDAIDLDMDLTVPRESGADDDVEVFCEHGLWHLRRGDFSAQFDPARRRGHVRAAANPYAIDSVLRIIHSIVLADEGGMLLHAASALRNGNAFIFAGVSGAGKTTITRLAPPDATVLSDEISYIRRMPTGYRACGTPFFGELARGGENVAGPLTALYFLEQGPANRIASLSPADAMNRLMRNILFFARDERLVEQVFSAANDLLAAVPAYRLTFLPDQRVWELIQ